MNGSIGSKNLTRSYFRTRRPPSPIDAMIFVPYPNPFLDSLHSSQNLIVMNVTVNPSISGSTGSIEVDDIMGITKGYNKGGWTFGVTVDAGYRGGGGGNFSSTGSR